MSIKRNKMSIFFSPKPAPFVEKWLNIFLCMIQINDSIVAKTTITVPVNGGAVEAVSTIETVPYWTRSRKKSGKNLEFNLAYKRKKKNYWFWNFTNMIVSTVAPAWGDTTTTDQSEAANEAPSTPVSDFPAQPQTPKPKGLKKHHFVSKTVRLCSCRS